MEGTTVYILGAGASVEASDPHNPFPDGKTRKSIIGESFAMKMDGRSSDLAHQIIHEAVVELAKDDSGYLHATKMGEYKYATQQIRNSMPLAPSIDNFVHAHNDNEKIVSCAKFAIVKDILIACVDGLKGFPDAINTAFPAIQVQLCIVHMVFLFALLSHSYLIGERKSTLIFEFTTSG